MPAGTPTAVFTAESDHTYAFYSLARDAAGNLESKPPAIEASTYVPDLTAPDTRVTTVDATTATFAVTFAGTDAGGSGLRAFDVFVQVDAQPVALVGLFPATPSGPGGAAAGSTTYQALADGVRTRSRFNAVGIDGGDDFERLRRRRRGVAVTATFAQQPPALQATAFTVQHGGTGRSYVRYVDVFFNLTGTPLQDLIDGHKIRLVQHQLDGVERPTNPVVRLGGVVRRSTMPSNSTSGPRASGATPTPSPTTVTTRSPLIWTPTRRPSRPGALLPAAGDVNGDHAVDTADLNVISAALGLAGPGLDADVNGDGTVNQLDRTLVGRSRGRKLAAGLRLDA